MLTKAIILALCITNSLQLYVSVYYESLCPDSIRFITNQLHPAYPILANEIDLDFVPYGKATHNFVNGRWVFKCQHGFKECFGNKIQACALAETNVQSEQESLVHCIMQSADPANGNIVRMCLDMLKISFENTYNCANGLEGSELLAKLGDQTHAVDPIITFIPTIVFDGKYNATLQANALKDFLHTACDLLPNPKPSGCQTKPRQPSLYDYNSFYRWFQ